MNRILLCVLFLAAHEAIAGEVLRPVIVTPADLAEKGIIVRKVAEKSVIPTWRIEIQIDMKPTAGSCQACELVVLDQPVYAETLKETEGFLYSKAVRVVRADTKRKTFVVYGNEVERSYVAITVLVGFDRMAISDRYLLPVTALSGEKDRD